jgi:hypothetical protein
VLGCVDIAGDVLFAPGKHYAWRYGQLTELADPAAPADIVAGFALLAVTSVAACTL